MSVIKKGVIINNQNIAKLYSDILAENDTYHRDIKEEFTKISSLYNISSVNEDIVLNNYLIAKDSIDSLSILNKMKQSIVIESFLNRKIYDAAFPVEAKVNFDTLNGDITLPVSATKDIIVSDIIINSQSNGKIGNSELGISTDLSVILNENNPEVFEYEYIVSQFKQFTLYFSFMLKLKISDIANALYLKFYAEDGYSYPEIIDIEISKDGVAFERVDSYSKYIKADHFIRFLPKEISFVKVSLKQDVYKYTNIQNKFVKRYSIGIRSISLKQVQYNTIGEYISKEFDFINRIDSIFFTEKSSSNGDIKYFLSANNGINWVEIPINEDMILGKFNFGLIGDFFISKIRIKARLERSDLPILLQQTDNFTPLLIGSYKTTKQINHRKDPSCFIGNHISIGSAVKYKIDIPDISSLNPKIVKTDANCIMAIGGNVSVDIPYVPWYDDLIDDIKISVNGMELLNDRSIWNVLQHPTDPYSSLFILNIANRTVFPWDTSIDSLGNTQDITSRFPSVLKSLNLSLTYAPLMIDHPDSKIISLTKPLLTLDKKAIDTKVFSLNELSQESLINRQVTGLDNSIVEDQINIDNIFDGILDTYMLSTSRENILVDNVQVPVWIISWEVNQEILPVAQQNIKKYSISTTGISQFGYDISPKKWDFQATNDQSDGWFTFDSRELNAASWESRNMQEFITSNTDDCIYKYYRIVIYENCSEDILFINNLAIANISVFYPERKPFDKEKDLEVVDRYTIKLSDSIFNTKWTYIFSYIPSIDISEKIRYTDDSNLSNFLIDTLQFELPSKMKIAFDYFYQSIDLKNIKRFYSPICNEFRMVIR